VWEGGAGEGGLESEWGREGGREGKKEWEWEWERERERRERERERETLWGALVAGRSAVKRWEKRELMRP
jgi:hypothetical protein